MPSVAIKTQSGAPAGTLELASLPAEPNAVLVREVYNALRANARQGTHSTKTRAFVRGGGKKPWKQKHTGRARQGSIRAPQWRHGAIIFGPLPRDYREKINRRKRRGAMLSILASKVSRGEVIAVDQIDLAASPKTKSVLAFLAAVGAKQGRVLIVTEGVNAALVRAAANLSASEQTPVRVAPRHAISVHDVLLADTLVITKDALAALEEKSKP